MSTRSENPITEKDSTQSSETLNKKPYHRPTLRRMGSVLNLTQNLEGIGADGGMGFVDDTRS